MNKGIAYLCIGVLFVLVNSCAQERNLSGGEADTTGPRVVKAIPPNYSTYFNSQNIYLEFNEYIELEDINSQLIVSPFMKQKPDVRISKKGLFVDFNEKLLPNTTYTISFGDGVKDFTAGNSASNLKYVFSTGAELDSLKISAKILDAQSNLPLEKVKFLLYSSLEDSVPLLEKPDYFGVSDESGFVMVENMKEGAYKAIALLDENLNYLYDEQESIAFAENPIDAQNVDSVSQDLILRMSKEVPKKYFEEFSTIDSLGGLKLVLNKSPNSLKFDVLESTEDQIHFYVDNRDTIHFWNTNPFLKNTDFRVSVLADSMLIDTFYLQTYDLDSPKKWKPKNKVANSFNATKNFTLDGKFIINSIDTSKIILLEDSLQLTSIFKVDPLKKTSMVLESKLQDGKKYILKMLPEAILTKEGFTNDTIQIDFTTYEKDYFGTLDLNVSNSDSIVNPFLEFIDTKGEVVFKKKMDGNLLKIDRLLPGEYTLRIIEDNSNNQKWDALNYFKKIQPERIFYFPEKIKIRSNWILEYEWRIING